MRCESMRWNARVHRLELGLDSSEKEFGGNGVIIHVNSKGKIRSPNSYWNELSGWGPHDSVCNQDIWDTVGAKTLKKKKTQEKNEQQAPRYTLISFRSCFCCMPALAAQPGISLLDAASSPAAPTRYPATPAQNTSHLYYHRSSHRLSCYSIMQLFPPVSLQIFSSYQHYQSSSLHTCLITDLFAPVSSKPVSSKIYSSHLSHYGSSLHTCIISDPLFKPVSLQIFSSHLYRSSLHTCITTDLLTAHPTTQHYIVHYIWFIADLLTGYPMSTTHYPTCNIPQQRTLHTCITTDLKTGYPATHSISSAPSSVDRNPSTYRHTCNVILQRALTHGEIFVYGWHTKSHSHSWFTHRITFTFPADNQTRIYLSGWYIELHLPLVDKQNCLYLSGKYKITLTFLANKQDHIYLSG